MLQLQYLGMLEMLEIGFELRAIRLLSKFRVLVTYYCFRNLFVGLCEEFGLVLAN